MAKRESWTALKNGDYDSAAGALYDINAMLPKDKERNYQIEISDLKYNESIRQDIVYICNWCSKECLHCTSREGKCIAEIPRKEVATRDVITDGLVYTITGKRSEKIWQCPKCNKDNLDFKTRKIQTILKQPYFLQVIPSAPIRKNGIIDRRTYDKKFKAWFMNFMNELSYQMSKYRLEYVPKDSEQKEEEVLDGQEHLDDFKI